MGRRKPYPKGQTKRSLGNPLDQAKAYEIVWQQVSPLFETARGIAGECSYVYVIGEENDGPVKIGVAHNPIARLRSMQTGNSRRLRVEHVLFGYAELEKLLHQMWEPFAIVAPTRQGKADIAPGTEWFRAESREQLFPIIATAAEHQIAYVRDIPPNGLAHPEDLEMLVRFAHGQHGYVARRPHQVHQFGVLGTFIERPSRI